MALNFIDSCAHYDNGSILRKWSSLVSASVGTAGRRNSPHLTIVGGNILKTLTHQATYIVGAAVQYIGLSAGACLTLANNTLPLIRLKLNDDHTVSVVAGQTIITGISAQVVSDPTSWHYYELKGHVAAAGSFVSCTATVHIDGANYGTYTGVSDVLISQLIDGQPTVNQVGFVAPGTLNFMDFYALDTVATDINGNASTNTTFFGDVEIDAVFPDEDVTVTWTKVGGSGTNAFTRVNETTPDDDTTYVYSTSTGSAESFKYTPITAFTGDILGAQYLVCAKKTAEGLRTMKLTADGVTVKTLDFFGTSNYLSDYYVYYIAPLDTDNGAVWSVSNFDAAAFGVILES